MTTSAAAWDICVVVAVVAELKCTRSGGHNGIKAELLGQIVIQKLSKRLRAFPSRLTCG